MAANCSLERPSLGNCSPTMAPSSLDATIIALLTRPAAADSVLLENKAPFTAASTFTTVARGEVRVPWSPQDSCYTLFNDYHNEQINTDIVHVYRLEEKFESGRGDFNADAIGIIIGVTLSSVCVIVCTACIVVRKQCVKNRQLSNGGGIRGGGDGGDCSAAAHFATATNSVQVRIDGGALMMTSSNADATTMSRDHPDEFERLVAVTHDQHDRTTAAEAAAAAAALAAASHLDTKGKDDYPNCHINGSAKHHLNGGINTVHITENPRYSNSTHNGHKNHQKIKAYEEDKNSNWRFPKFHRYFHTPEQLEEDCCENDSLNTTELTSLNLSVN